MIPNYDEQISGCKNMLDIADIDDFSNFGTNISIKCQTRQIMLILKREKHFYAEIFLYLSYFQTCQNI